MKQYFKRFTAVIALAFMLAAATSFMPVQTAPQPANAAVASDKDTTPPDPNRPSYDLWGNEFTATGQLITAACPNVPDPISGLNNPKCVCPDNTDQGAYFIRGNDKVTNQAVCGFSFYHACPYTEAVSADDPLCYKNPPQPVTPVASTPPATQCGGK